MPDFNPLVVAGIVMLLNLAWRQRHQWREDWRARTHKEGPGDRSGPATQNEV